MMKISLIKYAVLIALVFGIYAAASRVSAQITGGYGETAIDDAQVKEAAAVAIKAKSKKTGKKITLVKIEKAEVQVVAGLNYRICMSVKTGHSKPVKSKVTAVVYRDLKNKYSLSKWESGGCKEL
jgi:hypothetical protein